MISTPINQGLLQSNLDFAGFEPINLDGWPPSGGGGGGAMPGVFVNVKDAPYNAVGNGVADDTAAIQAAINYVFAQHGGVVFFPKGYYLCNGAFDAGTLSILKIPNTPNDAAHPTVAIELRGEIFGGILGASVATNVVIQTTKAMPSQAHAILAANPPSGSTGVILENLFNNVMLRIKNLDFLISVNPSMGGLRLDTCGACFLEEVRCFGSIPDLGGGLYGDPTTSAVGMWLPNSGNNALVYTTNTWASGFAVGYRVGEHFRGLNLSATNNSVGMDFMTANEGSYAYGMFNHCPTMIRFLGNHSVDIFMDCESANVPGWDANWAQTVYHVDDPSNYGCGLIRYALVTAYNGPDSNFKRNGGTKINTMDLYSGDMTMGSATKFLVGTDSRFTAISGGVKLETRNTGTGIWVESARWTNP